MSSWLKSVKVSSFCILWSFTVTVNKANNIGLLYFFLWFMSFPYNLMTHYLMCLYKMHIWVCVFVHAHKSYFLIFLKIVPGAGRLLFYGSSIGRASQCLCPSGELTQWWLWNKRWQKTDSCKYKKCMWCANFIGHSLLWISLLPYSFVAEVGGNSSVLIVVSTLLAIFYVK